MAENINSSVANESGALKNGLPGQIMRVALENKGLLSARGSMYVGTGSTNNITIQTQNGESVQYSIPETEAAVPMDDGVGKQFLIYSPLEEGSGVSWSNTIPGESVLGAVESANEAQHAINASDSATINGIKISKGEGDVINTDVGIISQKKLLWSGNTTVSSPLFNGEDVNENFANGEIVTLFTDPYTLNNRTFELVTERHGVFRFRFGNINLISGAIEDVAFSLPSATAKGVSGNYGAFLHSLHFLSYYAMPPHENRNFSLNIWTYRTDTAIKSEGVTIKCLKVYEIIE